MYAVNLFSGEKGYKVWSYSSSGVKSKFSKNLML